MPSVTLRPFLSPVGAGNDLTNRRLRLEIVSATDVDTNIFVAERYSLVGPGGLIMENRFIAVAKPTDMEALPVGAPDLSGTRPPFFRTNCVDLIYNSPSQLDEDFAAIKQEIGLLMRALTQLSTLEAGDDCVISG